MKAELKLLSPWVEPHSPAGLALELQREVSAGHILYGKAVKALAVARDRDDVLFAIDQAGSLHYAVVHLTNSRKQEPPPCPNTRIFESLEDWIEWMRADHDDYSYGDQ